MGSKRALIVSYRRSITSQVTTIGKFLQGDMANLLSTYSLLLGGDRGKLIEGCHCRRHFEENALDE